MSNQSSGTYTFTLILDGVTEPSEELENALFESGCGDALLFFRDRIGYLEFDRQGSDFESAVISGIYDVRRSNAGVDVARIEPCDPVMPAEIARRLNRTRESVRLLIRGDRGGGGFPLPIAGVTTKTMIWSWAEVAAWCYENGIIDNQAAVIQAQFLKTLNHSLTYQKDPSHLKQLHITIKKLTDTEYPTYNI